MDNYPSSLAPAFEEGGGVATPFDEWWPMARKHYEYVPEEVGRDWLHRHWSHSPFGWLPSAAYRFRLVEWPHDQLHNIRTGWSDFIEDPTPAIEHGRYLAVDHRKRFTYPLAEVMISTGTFPVPPVVIDNRDGHLASLPGASFPYPPAHLLIEGHRRFNIAAYLATIGQLRWAVPFWLMERADQG